MMKRILPISCGSVPGASSPSPARGKRHPVSPVRNAVGRLAAVWAWLRKQQQSHSHPRQLRLEETISFGQKRFIALVRVDGQRLLLGGGATEVALLANLGAVEPFSAQRHEPAVAQMRAPVKRTRRRTANAKVEPEQCI
jgi:hypothetical protein